VLLNIFKTKEAVQFASDLATEFTKRAPPAILAESTPQAESRLRGAKDLLVSRTQVFAERNRLNLFSRARLANTLKWRLREAGYKDDLTDALVLEVVRIITLIKATKKK